MIKKIKAEYAASVPVETGGLRRIEKARYNDRASAKIYIAQLEGYDNDLFAEQIISRGDKQERKTNIKAQMTEWRVNEPEWYDLCKDIVENHIIFLSGDLDITWRIVEIWGVNYKKGDSANYHAHRPFTFSFCYYPKVDIRDSSFLVFPQLQGEEKDHWYSVKPREGQLVIFPSYLIHGVPLQKENRGRMVIAGNIIAEYDPDRVPILL